MDIEEVLLDHSNTLGRIEGQLNNGLTKSIDEIKTDLKQFIANRENTCPLNDNISALEITVTKIKDKIDAIPEKKKDRRLALILGLCGGGGVISALAIALPKIFEFIRVMQQLTKALK